MDPAPLREGLNVVLNPLYDVVVMDGRVGKHSARYDAASKDLQAVHVEMVLNYRLHPDRAPEVYKSIGLEYSSVIIDPAAQEVLKATPPPTTRPRSSCAGRRSRRTSRATSPSGSPSTGSS